MAPIREWFGVYNIIYRWFEQRYGKKALEEYWKYIAQNCFSEILNRFSTGIVGVRDYLSETFDKDGGEYLSTIKGDSLIFEVTKCPDYDFMNSVFNINFKPIEDYCKHHEIFNSALAEKAGYSFCMAECNHKGQCKWVFEKTNQ